ncbi:MAG: DUF4099 domain-containing protein [Tannerella sp.]|jgi:hypothetical protein|nr:DUF4099 domain-containing protein [Tannerella sp.]
MKINDKATPFNEKDVNWDELAAIGILRDELELSGELDALLRGEKTGVISMQLILLGVDVEMDATLQLVRKGEEPILEIIGITPADMNK